MTEPSRRQTSSRRQPCDLCGGTTFRSVAHQDRRGDSLPTVMCEGCGLISHETIPTDAQLAEYYAREYRRDYHGEITPSAHRVLRAWEGGQWLFRLLRPYVPADAHVGEIGAGIGCTVKAFELAGYRASGIEPGQGFQQFSRESLLAQIECRDLFDLPATPRYDFLLLVHVIEHLNSPRRALHHLRSLLPRGGRLYVECPNIAAPHAAPHNQFHFAHIYNFTPATLTALAESCGFQVIARLAPDSDPNLRILLERTESVAAPRLDGLYQQACRDRERAEHWGYYWRPSYWQRRIQRDVGFVRQRLVAKRRLAEIVRQCQAHAHHAGGGTRRAA